jgi:hypothetical protein
MSAHWNREAEIQYRLLLLVLLHPQDQLHCHPL